MMLNGSAFADVDNSGRTGVLESRRFDTRSNVQCLEVWTNVEGENAELDVELWEADNVYGDIVRARYFTGVVPLLTDFFFPSNSILSKNSRNFMSPEHSWRFPDRKLPTWWYPGQMENQPLVSQCTRNIQSSTKRKTWLESGRCHCRRHLRYWQAMRVTPMGSEQLCQIVWRNKAWRIHRIRYNDGFNWP